MARSSEKATKAQVPRQKAVRSKARASAAANSAKKGTAQSVKPAKAKKRAESTAQAPKPAPAPRANKKSAVAKKTAPKRVKAKKPAAAAAFEARPQVLNKSRAAAAPQAPVAPIDRRPKAAKTVPPPPPAAVDKQAEQAAKAERQLELRQTENYERAVQYFNARKFSRALPFMEKAADGPNVTLRHRAHVYADICRRQIGDEKVELKTADDNYNYGVKLMNDRRLEEAERYLQRALRLAPKAGHVHYANAVLAALRGNVDAVFGNLKRAIEIDPLNRVLALNDADLHSVLTHPPIAHLLHQGGES
jgi:tetratricopeptide (TPR) repeat protein